MKNYDIDCYQVYENYDRSWTKIALFESLGDAESLAKTSVFYGVAEFKQSFVIFNSLDEYYKSQQQSKIQAALSKLTQEERQLLGLESRIKAS